MDILAAATGDRDPSPIAVDVTIVVVTYNSADLVLPCIRSIEADVATSRISAEILVVDNASADRTVETLRDALPRVTVIESAANDGFGRANNRAFAVARGRSWMLLNPDATLDPGGLRLLVDRLEGEPRLAAVAPSIESLGAGRAASAGMMPGIRSFLGHFLFVNRLPARLVSGAWRGFEIRTPSAGAPVPVDWVSGAAVLLRASAVREVGGFDPSIFLYGEDIELCRRLRRAGWQVELLPSARARHVVAGTQVGISTLWVDGLHRQDLELGVPKARLLAILMGIGLGLRSVVLVAAGPPRRQQLRRLKAASVRAFALALGAAPRV